MIKPEDISFIGLPRGRLCIWTDVDKPCARQLVVVHECFDNGSYAIEYVRSTRLVADGFAFPEDLTPIEAWGLRAEYSPTIGVLKVIPVNGTTTNATYKDGRPRKWQGEYLIGVHGDVDQLLADLYGRA